MSFESGLINKPWEEREYQKLPLYSKRQPFSAFLFATSTEKFLFYLRAGN